MGPEKSIVSKIKWLGDIDESVNMYFEERIVPLAETFNCLELMDEDVNYKD